MLDWQFSATLAASPFADRVCEAGEMLSLVQTRASLDYAQMTALENDIFAPILINQTQHYEILARLVTAFVEQVPAQRGVFIRATRFFALRAPECLLRPDVCFVDAPVAAARRAGGAALAVSDRLRRAPTEWRDNRLQLDLFGVAFGDAVLEAIVAQAGLHRYLRDIALRPVIALRPDIARAAALPSALAMAGG